MLAIPLALQLYSVKDEAAADLADVIAQAGDWGFDGVEFAGYHGHSASQVRTMLDAAGLQCAGAHVPIDQLEGEAVGATAEFHLAIGCPYLIVPWLPGDRRDSVEACKRTADLFNEIARSLVPHGLRAGFHCHAIDCKPLPDAPDKTPWSLLGELTGEAFIMQYDTANGLEGSGDAVAPVLANPGRGVSTHLKEYKVGATDDPETGHGQAVIGEGSVPWADVFAACEKPVDQGGAGTRWYVVEQEGHPTLNPMNAAKRGLDNLRAMGK